MLNIENLSIQLCNFYVGFCNYCFAEVCISLWLWIWLMYNFLFCRALGLTMRLYLRKRLALLFGCSQRSTRRGQKSSGGCPNVLVLVLFVAIYYPVRKAMVLVDEELPGPPLVGRRPLFHTPTPEPPAPNEILRSTALGVKTFNRP